MKWSKRTKWSNMLWFFRKPHWNLEISFLDSRTQTNRSLTIRSMVLQRQLVRAIGRWLVGSERSLFGLGIGTTMDSFHDEGIPPESHMVLNNLSRISKQSWGRWVRNW